MATVWAEHNAASTGRRWWPAEELVRSVGIKTLGRTLEVGCGNGANLWYLGEKSYFTVGVDFEQLACREAHGYMRSRGMGAELPRDPHSGIRSWAMDVSVVQADAWHLPFVSDTFDTVVDSMVSQHVPFGLHTGLYREYRRVIHKHGRFFLYHLIDVGGAKTPAPTPFDWQRLEMFPSAGLTCLPPARRLAEEVMNAGFTVERVGTMVRRAHVDRPETEASYAMIEATAK